MTSTSTETETPIDLAPFELMTQKDQVRHLNEFHSYWQSWNLTSKSKKADLEAYHADAHLRGEGLRKAHTHTALPEPSPSTPSPTNELARTKPLAQNQRRALRDLVDNDFLQLKAEVNQFAADMSAQRRAEITQEFKDKGADTVTLEIRARTLVEDFGKMRASLIAEALRSGIVLEMPAIRSDYSNDKISTKVNGLKDAIDAAEREVTADRTRALNSLERARLTAQRTVLMSGVSVDAISILDTIPSAHDLMMQAAVQRANPAVALAAGSVPSTSR